MQLFVVGRQARRWILALVLPIVLAACNTSAPGSVAQPAAPPPQPTSAPATQLSPTQAPAQAPATAAPTNAPTAPRPTVSNPAPVNSPAPAPTQAPVTQPSPTVAVAKATTPSKLNLNTATREEFLKVPSVGDRMVREFFEYRPYVSIQQFRREIGKYVNAQQVAEYEKYVYVPIDINKADAETLQQIPGIDKTISGQLIAGRPYASSDAFLKALAQQVGNDVVPVARGYLVAP